VEIAALSAKTLANYFLGDYAAALQDSQQGIDLAQRAQAWRMLGYHHLYRAMVELATGNIANADRHANQTILIGSQYHHAEIATSGYRVLGDIYFYLGDFEAAARHYSLAMQAGEDNFLSIDAQFRLLGIQVLTGGAQAEEQALAKIVQAAGENGMGMIWLLANLSLLLAYAHRLDWDATLALGAGLQAEARLRKIPSVEWMVTNTLAEAHTGRGELTEAIQQSRLSVQAAAGMPHPWIEIRARVLLNHALHQSGQNDPANLGRALQLLGQLGAQVPPDERYQPAFARFQHRVGAQLGTHPLAKTAHP
jgi:tetratricopeptide (TPR) repeat protein